MVQNAEGQKHLVITFGLCPFFQDQPVSDVKKCAFFAVSFGSEGSNICRHSILE